MSQYLLEPSATGREQDERQEGARGFVIPSRHLAETRYVAKRPFHRIVLLVPLAGAIAVDRPVRLGIYRTRGAI